MITDAVWNDFDKDGLKDLILVGEWMSPKFFKNDGQNLREVSALKNEINGLWQSIIPFDIDDDGDTDYLIGNWGTNSKFKASTKAPLKMYYADFDKNGSTETLVTLEKKGVYYPIEGLMGLTAQLETLRKKFTNYTSFAGKPIEEILGRESINNATILEVNELRSGYLENEGGNYAFVPFKTNCR